MSDIVWEPEPVLDVVPEPLVVDPPANSTFASRKAARLGGHKAIQAAENK